ncbi:MAG: methionine adenosyltransferase [Chloroflexi bacterium]|nr:MAG: methionine adenosyltransferase [Chloroflexota bacterium]RLC92435.1 MAG: methionine adenosyltransferase [Chloroflexota bacterium]HEY68591.1 methionine adenosyltransferase [Thermoflexia bacterium]
MTKRNIVVVEATGQFIEDIPVEIVERKGIGHPDSLCDGIAERISVEYTRWCQENLGVTLHHNFDKVQLVAGEVEVGYGGGYMLRPIHIQIAGRGTPAFQGRKVPMDEIAIEAARQHVRETMRYLDPNRHMVIDSYAGQGAEELQYVVEHVTANDTSFGVSHWPRSGLEHAVYETAQYINYKLIDEFPVGEDVKVMGLRRNGELTLTVALPFIATHIGDVTEYVEAKRAAEAAIQEYASQLDHRKVTVMVNTADDVANDVVYLTLTGTSAEMGDDGAVGRGNRVNGVIAPFRSTSLEAACGKNPVSHVGKVYNVLALLAAQDIVNRVPTVREATVYVLSQIGAPLDQPLVATALVRPTNGPLTPSIRADVQSVLDENLAHVHDVRTRILNRELTLF